MTFPQFRVGEGHDTHRTVASRPLILGGIHVTSGEFGLDGHSDADVLLHAIIDALLGAAGLGDIGDRFPNTDPQWKGADSAGLLQTVLAEVCSHGWRIQNLDCTIHAERPKLTVWKPLIRARLAELLAMDADQVNVKAKTAEKLGPVGEGLSIEARAIALLHPAVQP